MSTIITLNGNGRAPSKRASDFATLNDVANAVMNTHGPLAVVLEEMVTRVQVIEDHLGILAPVSPEAPPVASTDDTSTVGDIE